MTMSPEQDHTSNTKLLNEAALEGALSSCAENHPKLAKVIKCLWQVVSHQIENASAKIDHLTNVVETRTASGADPAPSGAKPIMIMSPSVPEVATKRGRQTDDTDEEPVAKRKRGRPQKSPVDNSSKKVSVEIPSTKPSGRTRTKLGLIKGAGKSRKSPEPPEPPEPPDPPVDKSTPSGGTPARRGPGRPRKSPKSPEPPVDKSTPSGGTPARRGPGRPRKSPKSPEPPVDKSTPSGGTPAGRGPGRPPKEKKQTQHEDVEVAIAHETDKTGQLYENFLRFIRK